MSTNLVYVVTGKKYLHPCSGNHLPGCLAEGFDRALLHDLFAGCVGLSALWIEQTLHE